MKKALAFLICVYILGTIIPAYALTYDELLQKADGYIASEDYDKALACYDLAIKTYPKNITAYTKAAVLKLDHDEYSEAAKYAENALAIDSTSPEAWLVKCRIDIATGDTESFDSDALYAEICGASLTEYSAEIGEMYAKTGDNEKALEYFSESTIEALNDNQKDLYRRALIKAGEKEKADALGLKGISVHDENLDNAFNSGYPKLIEMESAAFKIKASDLEISDYAKEVLNRDRKNAVETLQKALPDTSFSFFSKSPSGNSGFIFYEGIVITMYENKYHIVYSAYNKGAEDTDSHLRQFFKNISSYVFRVIGQDGFVYSSDGRYAAVRNNNNVTLRPIQEPILFDLSTGELILTATYSKDLDKPVSGIAVNPMFSSDGRYFYYWLWGKKQKLYRYDLKSSETEFCFETESKTNYPCFVELADGSLLAMDSGDSAGLLAARYNGDSWTVEEHKLGSNIPNWRIYKLLYSDNSGFACVFGKSNSYSSFRSIECAFQIINPENNFDGINKFLCITKDKYEVISLTPEEYQTLAEEKIDSDLFPYISITRALLSPDGNYLLLDTPYKNEESNFSGIFIVRLADLSVQKVRGLNSKAYRSTSDYVEWHSENLIVNTDSGIKTYQFIIGSAEDDLPEVDTRTEKEKLEDDIEKQKAKVESAETQLARWISGKKTEADINKQRSKVEKEKAKLAELEAALVELENKEAKNE